MTTNHPSSTKPQAVQAILGQIDKQFGKGTILRLGDGAATAPVPVISSGSLGLDIALGTGGLPRGRIVEVVPTGARGGDIVFDITLPDSWTSYRTERLPTLYTGPRWLTD